jgi:hypothetical protein
MDCLHRRSAEAVHRHSADLLRQAGKNADNAGQIVALRCLGIGATKDHIF